MSVELIDKIKPKNNGNFALVDAADVEMPDGTRLSEYNPQTGSGLPELTPEETGKILVSVNGQWIAVTPKLSYLMPGLSEADNGKLFSVVDGDVVLVSVADSAIKDYIDEYISSALEGDY